MFLFSILTYIITSMLVILPSVSPLLTYFFEVSYFQLLKRYLFPEFNITKSELIIFLYNWRFPYYLSSKLDDTQAFPITKVKTSESSLTNSYSLSIANWSQCFTNYISK